MIYAANFFVPKQWVTMASLVASTLPYGGSAQCCDLAKSSACPHGCNSTITLDKAWLESQLTTIDAFVANYSVPVWIDQWGSWEAAGGSVHSQAQYLSDVLALFEARGLHWTYWWWRDAFGEEHCRKRPKNVQHGFGYAMVCELDDGTVHADVTAFKVLARHLGTE
eukprot:SAG31_NODE_8008_length_1542_cov_2.801109_2_plen_166_part_00